MKNRIIKAIAIATFMAGLVAGELDSVPAMVNASDVYGEYSGNDAAEIPVTRSDTKSDVAESIAVERQKAEERTVINSTSNTADIALEEESAPSEQSSVKGVSSTAKRKSVKRRKTVVRKKNVSKAKARSAAAKKKAAKKRTATTSSKASTASTASTTSTTSTARAVSNTTSASSGVSISSYEDEVIRLVNQERAKEGLSALSGDSKLTRAAEIRAKELVTKFSHTRPDGESCFTVLEEVSLKDYKHVGENIAYGQKTPEKVMNSWMNSSGHRKNILTANFKKIGVGCYQDSSGTLYWVQLFYTAKE